jgi:hypothetical protein
MANIFMAQIDKLIQECALKENLNYILYYKRFIDDILIIWTGTEDQLKNLMSKINKLHHSIKFTCDYNITNKSTTYLDTTISLQNKELNTDLYRKPTDRVQYLLPNSCHPNHIFKNVPYSLALRILRICSNTETLYKRLEELRQMLLSRKCNTKVINNAKEKVKNIDRKTALVKVTKTETKRVVLAMTYNPKLPSVTQIIRKHWRTLTKDQKMLKIYPEPPMVAYKQPPNLKSLLCRAKLPSNKHPKRRLTGIQACNKPCNVCPNICKTKTFTSNQTQHTNKLNVLFNCATSGVINLASCLKCNKQYIGQTGRKFGTRMMEHLNNIYHKKTQWVSIFLYQTISTQTSLPK